VVVVSAQSADKNLQTDAKFVFILTLNNKSNFHCNNFSKSIKL